MILILGPRSIHGIDLRKLDLSQMRGQFFLWRAKISWLFVSKPHFSQTNLWPSFSNRDITIKQPQTCAWLVTQILYRLIHSLCLIIEDDSWIGRITLYLILSILLSNDHSKPVLIVDNLSSPRKVFLVKYLLGARTLAWSSGMNSRVMTMSSRWSTRLRRHSWITYRAYWKALSMDLSKLVCLVEIEKFK